MIVLLLFAFISGLITIFAPCIWPLLPIILSSTASGGRTKPLGITLGIMLSFGVLTLTISYIVKVIPFDPNALRFIAVIVIGFLGLTLIIPRLNQVVEGAVSRLSGKLGATKQKNKSGFSAGFITGLSLGVVWTPCAGPILATIATLAATKAVNFEVVLVTAVYILGVGIPLFLFTYAGAKLFQKSRVVNKYTGRIQQVFGVIMILTALAIFTNYDKVIQTKLLNAFPSYSGLLYSLESNQAVTNELNGLRGSQPIDQSKINMPMAQPGPLPKLGAAPDFVGISHWLNSDPLTMAQLRGKVVLVDFWTYTCINCIRTLPYVTSWYEKYKDQGFVVVGVHTPEFEFEHNTQNVKNAIKQYNIHYPVAQDNDYKTWNAYKNQYWPAHYLIDTTGQIREVHFGEGSYDETEHSIQKLLEEAGKKTQTDTVKVSADTVNATEPLSPETYIGSKRMQYYYPLQTLSDGNQNVTLEEQPPLSSFSLGGRWDIQPEFSTTTDSSTLVYHFTAKKVFLVLHPPQSGPATMKVFLDGEQIPSSVAGSDVKDGAVTIDTARLYNLVDFKDKVEDHVLKLEFQTPDTEVYAFTFG
jgi:cytochrome c biogenesis protein CcdA/thiol-disulfide isomerase/thioredoxin